MNTMNAPYRRPLSVSIKSDQTAKKVGEIVSVEYHRTWGEQYQVQVQDAEWGPEIFWLRESEVRF